MSDTPVGASADDLLGRFRGPAVWSRDGVRAPHKPLLVLLALARLLRGEDRLVEYRVADDQHRQLLVDFGPARHSYHPEYPFWRLQADGLWEIPEREQAEQSRTGKRTGDVPARILIDVGAHGGLPASIYDRLRREPQLAH